MDDFIIIIIILIIIAYMPGHIQKLRQRCWLTMLSK
jgi:hypothetical protein